MSVSSLITPDIKNNLILKVNEFYRRSEAESNLLMVFTRDDFVEKWRKVASPYDAAIRTNLPLVPISAGLESNNSALLDLVDEINAFIKDRLKNLAGMPDTVWFCSMLEYSTHRPLIHLLFRYQKADYITPKKINAALYGGLDRQLSVIREGSCEEESSSQASSRSTSFDEAGSRSTSVDESSSPASSRLPSTTSSDSSRLPSVDELLETPDDDSSDPSRPSSEQS